MKNILLFLCFFCLFDAEIRFLVGQETANENRPASYSTPLQTWTAINDAEEKEDFQLYFDLMTPGLLEEKKHKTIMNASYMLASTEHYQPPTTKNENQKIEKPPQETDPFAHRDEIMRQYNAILFSVREPLLKLMADHGLDYKAIQKKLDEAEEIAEKQRRSVSDKATNHILSETFTGDTKDFLRRFSTIQRQIGRELGKLNREQNEQDNTTEKEKTPEPEMLGVREKKDRAVLLIKRSIDPNSVWSVGGQRIRSHTERIPFRKIDGKWYLASEENEPYDTTPKKIAESEIPFSHELSIDIGDVVFFELPNGKTFAFWGASGWGVRIGEKPYHKAPMKFVPDEFGGQTLAGDDSYIRQGGVTTSSRTSRTIREWFINPYKIVLDGEDAKPLKLRIEKASEKEQITEETKRQYYLDRLKSESVDIRKDAIEELTEMVHMGHIYAGSPKENSDAVRPLLKDSDLEIAKLAHEALCTFGDEQTLLKLMTPLDPEWKGIYGGERICSYNLKQELDSVIKKAASFFDSKDEGEYAFAVGFFTRVEYPENSVAKKRILDSVKHSNPEIRAQVLGSLRYYTDDKDAAKIVQNILQNDKNTKVRIEALRAANRLSENIDSSVLVSFLKDKNPEVRDIACWAMQDKRDDPIIEAAMLEASHDENANVRAKVADTIGIMNIKSGFERLCEMLDDPEPEVRENAVYGLRRLDDPRMIDVLKKAIEKEKNTSVREEINETLNRAE